MTGTPADTADRAFTTPDGVGLCATIHRGGPGVPLLLIAGTGYGGATWPRDTIDALRAPRTIVTFDHRGTGRSGSSPGPYSTRQFAADAATVIEGLAQGPVHVLGHSMGGRVAQWVAIDRPDLVASLILASTGSGRAPDGSAAIRGVPYHTALGLARDGYRAHLRGQITSTFFTPEFAAEHPRTVDWLVEAFWGSRGNLADYLKHVVARQGHDASASLGSIDRPTLIVVGERDTHAGGTGSHWDQSRALEAVIAGSTFRSIPGLAHGLFWQWPDRTTAVVAEWLDALGRDRA
jgi:pimeloyl-ACP methyl ester carboxylesterase